MEQSTDIVKQIAGGNIINQEIQFDTDYIVNLHVYRPRSVSTLFSVIYKMSVSFFSALIGLGLAFSFYKIV